jgi:hypothetical protein
MIGASADIKIFSQFIQSNFFMFMGGDGEIINTLYRMWETLLQTRDLEPG